MNGEAKELRELAGKIERLVSESRIASVAWEPTRALCDYLCLRARVMELEDRLPKPPDSYMEYAKRGYVDPPQQIED
jgi:hypothetical protein